MSRSSRVTRSFGRSALLAMVVCAGLAMPVSAGPIDDTLTYQGELKDGVLPAAGTYDFRFRLYDALVGGLQVGVEVPRTATLDNGRFTVQLQFAGAFNGQDRFLEIDAAPAGSGAWVTLTPRTELTTAPNAAYSMNAGTSLNLNGQPASFYTNASNMSAGTLPSARLSGAYSSALTLSNVANVYFGSGSNLTGLNASNMSLGTLSDARLSSNVAFINANNDFIGAENSFGGEVGIGTTAPLYPLHIVDPGGYSLRIDNTGGASFSGGVYVVTDSTSTQYGFIADLNGSGTTSYNYWANNASPGGRGYYAVMQDNTGTATSYGVYISNANPSGYGGYFNNTATTGTTYGVYCENNSTSGYGLYALHDATTGTGPANYGRTDSPSGSAFAIHGHVNTTTGGGFSAGVRGQHNGTGGGGIGVYGSHAGSGWGGYFTSVDGFGVYGYSTGSYGGYFDTGVAGGPALYVVGTASVGVITIRGGADLAEKFEVKTDPDSVQPGMVVMIDDEHEGAMELATGAYNRRVAGIVSGANELNAGMVLGEFEGMEGGKAIALTGRVWTFVDASDKAVEPGDLLTTSNTPGYAMPVIDHERASGATIGKAMSKLEKGEKGMVLVLVNLQ